MIPFPLYAKIKDHYCIGYYGDSEETILQLKRARPIIETELPGIKIYISCNDEKIHLLNNEERIIPRSQLETVIKEIAYFREITTESVIDLLEESNITYNKKDVLLHT